MARQDYDSLREVEARQRAERARQEVERAARLAAVAGDRVRRDYRQLHDVADQQRAAKAAEAQQSSEQAQQARPAEAVQQAAQAEKEQAQRDAVLLSIAKEAQSLRNTISNPQRLATELRGIEVREEREYAYQLAKLEKTEPNNFEKADLLLAHLDSVKRAMYDPQKVIKEQEEKLAARPKPAEPQKDPPTPAPQQSSGRPVSHISREIRHQSADPLTRYEARVADHNLDVAGQRGRPGQEVTDRQAERTSRQAETTDRKQLTVAKEARLQAIYGHAADRSAKEREHGRDR